MDKYFNDTLRVVSGFSKSVAWIVLLWYFDKEINSDKVVFRSYNRKHTLRKYQHNQSLPRTQYKPVTVKLLNTRGTRVCVSRYSRVRLGTCIGPRSHHKCFGVSFALLILWCIRCFCNRFFWHRRRNSNTSFNIFAHGWYIFLLGWCDGFGAGWCEVEEATVDANGRRPSTRQSQAKRRASPLLHSAIWHHEHLVWRFEPTADLLMLLFTRCTNLAKVLFVDA